MFPIIMGSLNDEFMMLMKKKNMQKIPNVFLIHEFAFLRQYNNFYLY